MVDFKPSLSGTLLDLPSKSSLAAGDFVVLVNANGIPMQRLPAATIRGGLDAFQIAQSHGFEGTETEWLASLSGEDGSSAYALAVAAGFSGSESEWLASLHGADGNDGTDGTNGTDGSDGESAYDIAVAEGFVGTEIQWLNSLHGSNGVSAYDVAVAQGFVGTPSQWLASLKGADGANITDIDVVGDNLIITLSDGTEINAGNVRGLPGNGIGDMTKAVYDPSNKNADAFARSNHTGTQTLATISDAGTAASKNTGTAAGNVPLLDGSGLLDTAILPAVAITDVFVVATQAAMLALTAQRGDIAIRTDLNKSFALSTNSPTTLADWKELLTPTDVVLSVAGLSGAISASALKTALALVKADVGLGNVANTAPADLPISNATQGALEAKQPLDTQLTSIASLTFAGNAAKVIRVNATADGFELATASGGSADRKTIIRMSLAL